MGLEGQRAIFGSRVSQESRDNDMWNLRMTLLILPLAFRSALSHRLGAEHSAFGDSAYLDQPPSRPS